MSTLTPLLSLVKPDGGDIVNVSNFNTNSDVLDNAVLLTAAQTLTNKTITAPSISAPTITSGATISGSATIAGGLTISSTGLTVSDGGITMSAGALVMSGAAGIAKAIHINATSVATSASLGIGIHNAVALTTASNSAQMTATLVAPVFSHTGGATSTTQRGIHIDPTFGSVNSAEMVHLDIAADSTADATGGAKYGIRIGAQTGNNVQNYGIYIEAPSGASITNLGIYNEGNAILCGASSFLSFYGVAAVQKPTVSGSRAGNAALADLLTELATLGLITDSSSA